MLKSTLQLNNKYTCQVKEEPWKPTHYTTGTILLPQPSGWHIFGLTEWSNEVILFHIMYHQDYLNSLYMILDCSLGEQVTWGLQWRQQHKVLQNINYHPHNTLQTKIQQSLLWKPKSYARYKIVTEHSRTFPSN